MYNFTTYKTAIEWLDNNIILLNNIINIDRSVLQNKRFSSEEDIFQQFVTDCTEDDVEWLEKTFGLLFSYSELLNKYILCVNHFGTSWSYVSCEVLSDSWWDDNKGQYDYKILTGYEPQKERKNKK